jgi:acyl-coenzyme A synthetase/AMP-(fatty) acid ligase
LQSVPPISEPQLTVGQFLEEIKSGLPAAIKAENFGAFSLAPRSLASVADTVLANLRRFCYERLAQYKVPKEFKIVDHLPKTASGKIRR